MSTFWVANEPVKYEIHRRKRDEIHVIRYEGSDEDFTQALVRIETIGPQLQMRQFDGDLDFIAQLNRDNLTQLASRGQSLWLKLWAVITTYTPDMGKVEA